MKTQASVPVDRRLTLAHVMNNTGSGQTYNTSERESSLESQLQSLYTPSPEDHFDFSSFLEAPLNTTANITSDWQAPRLGAGDSEAFQRSPPYTSPPPCLSGYTGEATAVSNPVASQADAQPLEDRRGHVQAPSQLLHQYNLPNRTLVSEGQFTAMQPMAHASHGIQHQQTGARNSAYDAFGGLFQDAQSARMYRKTQLRFRRKPYRPPDSDPSIYELKNSRQLQVKRIYDAMTRADAAKDNPGSIAMRRWAHSAFYPAEVVEAFAHKVFDCLLEQAEEGFRGWHHNDYASDERKGEPEDKNVSCAERLENIIQGLEEEKTICEDVITSACQIRMFVNAPRAYARRKEANRHGNSKRGKTMAGNPNAGSSTRRARKLSVRQANRSRQSTPSAPPPATANADHVLRDVQPNMQTPASQGPYYHLQQTHRGLSASSAQSPGVNRSPSFNSGYSQPSNMMSPPQPAAVNSPFAPASGQHYTGSPFMSPEPASGRRGGAATQMTSSTQYNEDPFASSWAPTDLMGNSSYNIHGSEELGMNNWDLTNADMKSTTTPLKQEDRHQDDFSPTRGLGADYNIDPIFQTYWDNQHNVQPFPSDALNPHEQKQ
jgi:hypothetical protein